MSISPKVCIIGAGPAGLAAARHLKDRGITYDQLERHNDVGGIWDINNPGTPMYDSAHFISSRFTAGYYGFPMPEYFPDYPGHRLVLEYTRQFAVAYGLYEHIQFNRSVDSVVKAGDVWEVTLSNGEQSRYSHVICASGHTWEPNWPGYEGEFSGEIMHSVDYQSADIFKGKRVLVVGAGNSACDIACDAAQSADAAFISMRRGYHFIPKHIDGEPTDVFVAKSRWMHIKPRRWLFERILKRVNGDLTALGFETPDHRLLESHPIINSQLIHYIQHGDISACRDIERLDGDDVVFKDGRRRKIDLIIYATGFKYDIPYANTEYFQWTGYKPRLGYTIFNRKHDTLYAAGFTEMNAGGYYIFDEMTSLIADAIDTHINRPEQWPRVRDSVSEDVDFSGGINFIKSERHADYINMDSYLKACRTLSRRLGWLPARTRLEGMSQQPALPQPDILIAAE